MTQAPRTARFTARSVGAALWVGAFGVIVFAGSRVTPRLTGLAQLIVGAAVAALVGATPLVVRDETGRDLLERLRPGLLLGAAPLALLTSVAGGPGSSTVVLPALWALALGWSGARLAALLSASGTFVLGVAGQVAMHRAIAFADLACASALFGAAVIAPVLARRRELASVLGPRVPTPREAHARLRREPTPGAVQLRPASESDRFSDLTVLRSYLADVREHSCADEVVLWHWAEADQTLHPVAWSTAIEVQAFAAETAGPVVEWAAREDIVVRDAGDGTVRVVAAPVRCGGRRFGALALFADAGLRLPPREARTRAAAHAGHVSRLLDLLEARRSSSQDAALTRIMLRAGERFQRDLEPEALARGICEAAIEVTGASSASLVSWIAELGRGEVVHATQRSRAFRGLELAPESLAATACRERQRLLVSDTTQAARGADLFSPFVSAGSTRSIAIAPIVREYAALGAIVVEGDREGQLGPGEGEMLALLAQVASLALENSRRLSAASARATTDALTGLANRYAFDERLRQLLAASDRFGQPVAMILMDIDLFKRVNDTHGHEAGDVVLREAARIVARTVRSVDVACRYGGEELAVLLPQTGMDGAQLVAERLRERLGARRIPLGEQQVSVTASFGVACYPANARSATGLFAAADRALYAAKADGRNCVKSADVSADIPVI